MTSDERGYHLGGWAESDSPCPVFGANYHAGVSGAMREMIERVDVSDWGEVCIDYDEERGMSYLYAHGTPDNE